MNRKQAILGSFRKWHGICNDNLDVFCAEEECSLCHRFDCHDCPLDDVGQPCAANDSVWKRISNLLTWYGTHQAQELWDNIEEGQMVTLSMLNNEELTEECNKMLSIIEGLCRKEGLEV